MTIEQAMNEIIILKEKLRISNQFASRMTIERDELGDEVVRLEKIIDAGRTTE